MGNDDLARIKRNKTGEEIDERAFSRPVGPNDSRNFSLFKGKRKMVNGFYAVKMFEDMFGFKNWHTQKRLYLQRRRLYSYKGTEPLGNLS